MKYIVYQITNNINGKIYIGCHKTADVNDGYMGSGKLLGLAIKKYGVENFSKEILHTFNSSEEMFEKEIELVNEQFITNPETYNIRTGGFGGWDHLNTSDQKHLARCKKAGEKGGPNAMKKLQAHMKELAQNEPEHFEQIKEKRRDSLLRYYDKRGSKGHFTGQKHSEETRNIIAEKAKERLKDPTKNSQFGTCWITNGTENKKIKKDQLEAYLQVGWSKGRTMVTVA